MIRFFLGLTVSVALCLGSMLLNGCSMFLRPIRTALKGSELEHRPSNTSPEIEDAAVGSQPFEGESRDLAAFTEQVQTLIRKRDSAALDKMAFRLRTGKERFAKGGGWKIHSFYLLTGSPSDSSETGWRSLIQLLEVWKSTSPNSITARVALANAYIGYAWKARGTGWAKDIPPEGWSVFEDRMRSAASEIAGASELNDPCYGYFEALLFVDRALDYNSDRFEQDFQDAISYDPTYQYFYTAKAVNLMLRWHGRPGELHDFVESLPAALGETEGLKMYYLVASEVRDSDRQNEFFERNGLSWRKTKKGFIQHEKDHGLTKYRLNQFADMTLAAKDAQATCSTFKRLGEKDFDAEIWKDQKNFEGKKSLALNFMCKVPQFNNQAE